MREVSRADPSKNPDCHEIVMVLLNGELHRFRKGYVDTLHEEGVSVNTIRIRGST